MLVSTTALLLEHLLEDTAELRVDGGSEERKKGDER